MSVRCNAFRRGGTGPEARTSGFRNLDCLSSLANECPNQILADRAPAAPSSVVCRRRRGGYRHGRRLDDAEHQPRQCADAAAGPGRERRRLPAERIAVGGLSVRQGRADGLPRGAGDRRPDRHQRGHDHAGVLALFRSRQPPDRQARRLCRARRAAVRHRGERVRPGPQRPGDRGRGRREGEVQVGAGADVREAPARPAGDPRRRAKRPRAGAIGSGAGAGRPACRRDHAGGGAQSAPYPRPQRRGDRRPREARSRRRGDRRGRADWRDRHPAQGRAGSVHQRRRQRPGLHDRRPVDGVAGRQRARVPTRPG